MPSFRDLALGLALTLPGQALDFNGFFQQKPQQQFPLPSPSGGEVGRPSASRPNILFILTDDQDVHMNSLDHVPLIKKHLIDQGTLYKRHFCTTALCCPSRVTLWTGKATHNTNVTDVNPPHGGYPKFVSQGLNESYLPIWLQEAGYDTYYTGKLFNAHTIENYNAPHVSGWTGSDFLLDPYTYDYLNSTYQRNHDPPRSYEGRHTVDVLTEKAYGFLDDAVHGDNPFFLAVAPVAPHSNLVGDKVPKTPEDIANRTEGSFATPPIPAKRHEHLFKGLKIPRTENFNPDVASGAGWIKDLPKQSQENIDYNDWFFRQRLRALQSVDELVDGLITRLDEYGVLDNTYIMYTTDNGYHIGQHRLQPGKECGFEEDINIPLIIRGPGVPRGLATDIVTTHTDLAPTILDLARSTKGLVSGHDGVVFDGEKVPLSEEGLARAAAGSRHEHVNVEYWGFAVSEGEDFGSQMYWTNNTYKALRVVSDRWNLYYSVWCHGEHELYDLKTDPGQLNNLLASSSSSSPPSSSIKLQGFPLPKLVSRLDSLLFVLKSCVGITCTRPWDALHPLNKNVDSLSDALHPRFDSFYETEQARVQFNRCEMGYIRDAEGPQFETEGKTYIAAADANEYSRDGFKWSEWT